MSHRPCRGLLDAVGCPSGRTAQLACDGVVPAMCGCGWTAVLRIGMEQLMNDDNVVKKVLSSAARAL